MTNTDCQPEGEPLLFKGVDFPLTEVAQVATDQGRIAGTGC